MTADKAHSVAGGHQLLQRTGRSSTHRQHHDAVRRPRSTAFDRNQQLHNADLCGSDFYHRDSNRGGDFSEPNSRIGAKDCDAAVATNTTVADEPQRSMPASEEQTNRPPPEPPPTTRAPPEPPVRDGGPPGLEDQGEFDFSSDDDDSPNDGAATTGPGLQLLKELDSAAAQALRSKRRGYGATPRRSNGSNTRPRVISPQASPQLRMRSRLFLENTTNQRRVSAGRRQAEPTQRPARPSARIPQPDARVQPSPVNQCSPSAGPTRTGAGVVPTTTATTVPTTLGVNNNQRPTGAGPTANNAPPPPTTAPDLAAPPPRKRAKRREKIWLDASGKLPIIDSSYQFCSLGSRRAHSPVRPDWPPTGGTRLEEARPPQLRLLGLPTREQPEANAAAD